MSRDAHPEVFPSPDSWYVHRVSYGETDQMGYLYYGEYLHLFERARSQFIRERGMSYVEVERRGVWLPVREAGCRYRIPARYDDEIHIRCGIDQWRRASVHFIYEVRDAAREVVMTTGFTEHACAGPDGRPKRIPDWLRELFS